MKGRTILAALVLGWFLVALGTTSAMAQAAKSASKRKEAVAAKPEPADDAKTSSPSSGPEKVLADLGLTRKERLYVLDEASAIEKYHAARGLLMEMQKASARTAKIAAYDEGIQELTAQEQMLQQRVTAAQSQLNSMNGGYRRMRQLVNQQQAPLRNQQTQDKAMIKQLSAQITAAKSKGPKPDERKSAPAALESSRQSYISAVQELDSQVAPLVMKYHDIGKRTEVIQALEQISHTEKHIYKVGASPDLVAATKMIIEVKKNLPHSGKASARTTPKAKVKSAKESS